MRIVVDTTACSSSLEDAEDLDRFAVEVHGDGDVEAALAPFGRLEGDHAWIAADMVRAAAARAGVGDGWDERFGAMLAYAGSKGWVDETGEHIRAHLDRD